MPGKFTLARLAQEVLMHPSNSKLVHVEIQPSVQALPRRV